MNAVEKAKRAEEMVADRALGMSYAAIARKYEVSVDTVQRAWKTHWEVNKPEMNRNPLDVVQEAIHRYEALIAEFATILRNATEDNNKIGAGKALSDAQTRMIELMQATGLLPKQLGTLRYIKDQRVILEVTMEVFERNGVPEKVIEELADALEQRAALN